MRVPSLSLRMADPPAAVVSRSPSFRGRPTPSVRGTWPGVCANPTPREDTTSPTAPETARDAGAAGVAGVDGGVWAQASRGRHNTPSAQCPARARRVVNFCFMQVLQLGRSAPRRPPSSMIIMPLQQARSEPESGYCVRRPNRCPTRNRRIAPGSVKFDA